MAITVNNGKVNSVREINTSTTETTAQVSASVSPLVESIPDNTDKLEISAKKAEENLSTTESKASQAKKSSDAADKIDSLSDNIKDMEEEVEKLTAQLIEKRTELQEKEELLEEQQAEYEEKQDEIAELNARRQQLAIAMNTEAASIMNEFDRLRASTISKAKSEYDPECGMTLEEYIAEKLKDVAISDTHQAKFEDYKRQDAILGDALRAAQEDLSLIVQNVRTTQSEITGLKTDISGIASTIKKDNADIKTAKSEIQGLLPDLISDEDMAVINENGIDLNEKTQDGSYRYVIGKNPATGAYQVFDTSDTMTDDSGKVYYRLVSEKYKPEPEEDTKEPDETKTDDKKDAADAAVQAPATEAPESVPTAAPADVAEEDEDDKADDEKEEEPPKTPQELGYATYQNAYVYSETGRMTPKAHEHAAEMAINVGAKGFTTKVGSDFNDDEEPQNSFEALLKQASAEGLINGDDDTVIDENDLDVLEEKYGTTISGITDELLEDPLQGISDVEFTKTQYTEISRTITSGKSEVQKAIDAINKAFEYTKQDK